MRGLAIPAGKHKIEFKFEPVTYTNGNNIATIGSILLIITIGTGLFLNKRIMLLLVNLIILLETQAKKLDERFYF